MSAEATTQAARPMHVVLVHGLLMNGWCLRRMATLLSQLGFRPHIFGYRTRKGSLDQHADALADFINAINATRVHLVGHSLGGLVVSRALRRHQLPYGRVALLGSPMAGSSVARRLVKLKLGGLFMGQARKALVAGEVPPTQRQVGVVLGSRNAGAGRLIGVRGPADGTVTHAEALIDCSSDQCCLPVTHTTMIFSADVASEVACFLERGTFTGKHVMPGESATGMRKPAPN